MKLRSIYEYRDYRKYLEDYIDSRPSKGRGEKSKIANALRCHNAYLSQVLSGKADLSLEQAHSLGRYLSFSSDEIEQILLLVQLARAGSDDLRKHIIKKLEVGEAARSLLQSRVQAKKTLSREENATYFSTWYYSVIHLMVATLKGFQTPEKIESALALPQKTVRDTLKFLEQTGIIQRDGAGYKPGLVDIHLASDDAMIVPHHTHWRLKAVKSLENRGSNDLHYSTALTISEVDFKVIREHLLSAIENTRETLSKTKPEKLAVLTLDWFELVQ